ncbi:saccharopine dehydrogenase [Alteromonas lipolytica]|uniref:Saccharopine dehydrogenase [NAD(+), L-lysine-forming] n=1 Tax=Alteromonas lipolytica TaxID=1856405 RepID=A0A1E8FJV9_9ALTE|nr:saccharopine dehydrogenase [Alteromonas lipolytica]OFI36229.1 hypothetical protein BFC17_08905 [Alteromonas lipolytica]GGF78968.1 saccharopine dehydrogenase [Alteromonas lipolytica]
MRPILWLRKEIKAGEKRVALTPGHCKTLVENGYDVIVEACGNRVFADQEYADAGASITTESFYQAPEHAIILGLKELPENTQPLTHTHIYFAHAYKQQEEAESILQRFDQGQGKIFDLEFLTTPDNRRIAAFGYWAGFIGAAMGVLGYAHYKQQSTPFPPAIIFASKQELIDTLKARLTDLPTPEAMVMGALGRCGTGASDLFSALAIPTLKWDKAEYDAAQKPIAEILQCDIFVNCVLLQGENSPMITRESLKQNQQLSIISDVSCDPNSPFNPIPVYDHITKLAAPFIDIESDSELPVHLQAIDHLPTLLPKESSEEFANALFPHLVAFLDALTAQAELPVVWQRGLAEYDKAQAKRK